MRRRWGLVLLLLCAACPSGHDPYTAARYRRDEVVRAEAGRQYRLRIAADHESQSLAEMADRLAAIRLPSPARHVPPRASRSGRRGCGSLEDVKTRESGGNYGAQNRSSSASGAYQYLDSSWNGYGGYASAKDAPPAVQDQRAREDWAAGKHRQWVVCH